MGWISRIISRFRRDDGIAEQVDEDTCATHNVFLCDRCFDV